MGRHHFGDGLAVRAEPPAQAADCSVPEAARQLRVSRATIWRWIRTGRLPASRVGPRTTRIRQADLERLLAPVGLLGRRYAPELEALAEHVPDVIACFDTQLRHTYVNPAAERVTGRPRAAFVGKTNRELGMPEDLAAQWESAMQQVLQTGREERIAFSFPSPSLTSHFESHLIPEFGPDGAVEGILVIARDVTDRTQVQHALREREVLNRAVLDSLAAHIAVLDRRGVITTINQAWDRFARSAGSSLTREAWVGVDYLEVCRSATGPDSAEAQQAGAGIQAVLDGSRPEFELEYVCQTPTGPRWFILSVTPLLGLRGGAVVSHVDVTERKRAELAVAHSEARVQRLADLTRALGEALTPADVAQTILSAGVPALEAEAGMVCLRSQDGRSLETVGVVNIPAEVVATWRSFPLESPVPMAEVVRIGEPILLGSLEEAAQRYPLLAATFRAQRAEALVQLPLLAKILPDRPVLGAIGFRFPRPRQFSTDERAFLEALAGRCAQALERAELFAAEQAARAVAEQALRNRDDFIALVCHELRSPLSAIRGYAQLLQRRSPSPDPVLERIVGQTQQLTRLVDDLAGAAELGSGQLRLERAAVDVVQVARSVVEQARQQGTSHALLLEGVRGPLIGVWDPGRLEQILHNLVGNAIKYSPAGGEIVVQVTDQGDQAQISVRDQGLGIPPEALPKLFDRFYRVERKTCRSSGLGLGLFITRTLVEAHGGRIWVESEPGRGSTFYVTLPYTGDSDE